MKVLKNRKQSRKVFQNKIAPIFFDTGFTFCKRLYKRYGKKGQDVVELDEIKMKR